MANLEALRRLLNNRLKMPILHVTKPSLADPETSRSRYPFYVLTSGRAGKNVLKSFADQRSARAGTWALLALMALGVMLVPPAQASEWNMDQLMQSLAQAKSGRANFVEKKFITMLEKPIESSGRLRFIAPDTLEMHTLKPKTELMLVQGDTLTMDHHEIQLSDHPELLAFIDSIRGTLTGNRQMLDQFFSLSLEGSEDNWTLTMVPKQKKVAEVIQHILVSGSGKSVTGIDILKTNHDRSLISIDKAAAP
ncbi:MAG: LolA family protein [Acidithiobacillus sp.]